MARVKTWRWLGAAVVVALLGVGLWWTRRDRAGEAHPPAAALPAAAGAKLAVARGAPVAPARLAITVRDEHGPLAGASVRLAPGDGEILVVRTGGDGVAHATLDPGRWRISGSAPDHEPSALPETELAAGDERTLAIELVSGGRTLRGTVTDATGGPIAGARIDAARLLAGSRPGAAVATTLTAGNGSYRLSVAPGTVMVAAASADYAPQARSIEITGTADAVADFALVPGGAIEGVVRDEHTRAPAGGARVFATRDSPILLAENSTRQVVAGSDGRFRVTGLRPGAWSLSATEGARFSKHPASVGLGVAEQVADVDLLIGAGPAIRGTVVDETGAPAGVVEVNAFASDGRGKVTADARGGFVFERLGPGNYALTASSASFLAGEPTQVALIDKDVDGAVVKVTSAVTIRGHVEPRQPCEIQRSAEVQNGFSLPGMPVSSGSDGAFVLGAAREGALELTARCASGDQGTRSVAITRGMPDIVLAVRAGGSIAGHVVDGDGKPVAGAGVVASEVSHGAHMVIRGGILTSGAQAVSDATGAYRIDGLAAGSYQLGALDRGAMIDARKAPRVELAAQARETGVDLVIDRPDGVIAGTVLDPDGKPLPDAWVSIEQNISAMMATRRTETAMVSMMNGDAPPDAGYPPVLSDARGHYEIRDLSHAIFDLTAEAQHGQLRARVERIKPGATVDLKTSAVAVLSGTVNGPAGPASLFEITLEGPSFGEHSFTGGTFSFGRVDPGPYTLRVTSTEGSAVAKVVVKPGEPATLAITLTANATVVGALVDPAGAPLAGVAVVLVEDVDEGEPSIVINGPPVTTGPDGRFRLTHAAQPSALIVLPPRHAMTSRPFSKRHLALEPGKTLDVGVVTVTPPAAPGAGSGTSPPGPGGPATPPPPAGPGTPPPRRENRSAPDVATRR